MKTLVLNSVEEKTLKKEGFVNVKRGKATYQVALDENNMPQIMDTQTEVVAILPLEFPKNGILLTYEENKQLIDTGRTTHKKGGVLYTITMDSFGVHVSCDNQFDNVLLFSQTR